MSSSSAGNATEVRNQRKFCITPSAPDGFLFLWKLFILFRQAIILLYYLNSGYSLLKAIRLFFNKISAVQLTTKWFILLIAAFALLRLLLTAGQQVELAPEITMFDDMLAYNGAKSIAAGEWLGSYNYLTMGKYMGFSLWLAALHKLGIPFLLAGHLLSVCTCVVLLWALSPAIRNNLYRVAFFAVLVLCPALYANYTLRVYRDNITVSFALLAIASVIGMALRYRQRNMKSFWFFAVCGGLSFGASMLLREDAYWLWPIIGVGCAVTLIMMFLYKDERKWQKLISLTVFFVLAFACVGAWCGMNYKYYGRFIISDFTSKESKAAYGAVIRIETSADVHLRTPLPYAYRLQLYAASPTFSTLERYLEDPAFSALWKKDNGDGKLEFSGSGLYWAIRSAASYAGYYETPETAIAFYEKLAQELNDAYDSGILKPAGGRRSALNTALSGKYILPTLKEVASSIYVVTTYQGITCDPVQAVGPPELLREMQDFLHTDALIPVYAENADTRIRIWAFSDNGTVSFAVRAADGSPVPANIVPSTGGDLHYDFLRQGLMQQPLRYTIFIGADSMRSDHAIALSDGVQQIAVPLQASDQQTADGITYRIEYVGKDYSEQVEYGFVRLWLYRLMRVVVYGYKVLSPLLLLGALVCCVLAAVHAVKRGKGNHVPENVLLGLITTGVGGTALLRIGMVSFVEVSMAGIGTYPMYLSAIYPLLLIFSFLAIQLYCSIKPKGAEFAESDK